MIALSSYLWNFVVANGSDPEDHCVWFTLMVQDCLLEFCVVFAPNLNLQCGQLWDWMAPSVLAVDWIARGEFNMVE